jgi:CheY-like chemotaxis protein
MQADRTLARSGGGLGLGLVLVKGLIELHGGQVSASSDGIGKGAEFIVRLPLDGAAADVVAPAPAARAAPARQRVLVIDDDRDVADALCSALAVGGHDVEIAHNAADGIGKAHVFKPEVVLCDIGLPGTSGYDVARLIRADPELRTVRLVALSGYAQSADVNKARDAGFDDHLAKPPTIDKVLAVLTPRAPR